MSGCCEKDIEVKTNSNSQENSTLKILNFILKILRKIFTKH